LHILVLIITIIRGGDLCIIIGIAAGILSELFGIGGGIIIIPALMFLQGFIQ